MEKVGSVYVISPQEISQATTAPIVRKTYTLSGQVVDSSTGEPLPYAQIQTAKGIATGNEAGHFSLAFDTNESVRIQAQYIGYEVVDTVLNMGSHKLELATKLIALDEVIISTPSSTLLMQSGRTSGEVRANPQTARYLPGSVDNSVFNLMRMIPGVRASGEPSEELIVWGSNLGESQLTYDGFTIYGMKTFNDQISSVNPYLAKDLRLLKGGYDASLGGRIGAIAEVTGYEGDFNKPSMKANVSNYTANLFASVPILKRAVLSAAYRQTFYNLYEQTRSDSEEEAHDQQENLSDVYIKPQYDFRDVNLKLAGRAFESDRYYISLYGAEDHFKFSATQQSYDVEATEKNRQYGAAASYNRVWHNSNNTQLRLSYSQLSADIDNVSGISSNQTVPLQKNYIGNSIQDLSLVLEHRFNMGKRQQIEVGGKWQQYRNRLNGNSNQIDNPALYLTDNIRLGKLSLQTGLRADWVIGEKVHLQPRISARYTISNELTATASFGLYNQFLTRVPYQYGTGSYQFVWSLSERTFLSSSQLLTGVAYSKNGWLLSAEGYLKKSRNELYFLNNGVYPVDNTIYGADLYIKKQWRQNTVFGSYSLVKSSQPEQNRGEEIKAGAVYALRPFYLSATYVYGTGFPYLTTGGHGHGQSHGTEHSNSDSDSDTPYSRLDLSLTYKLPLKRVQLQAGASVLNLFNTNNIKYNYRLADQSNVINVYTKATSLTPILFLEIIF